MKKLFAALGIAFGLCTSAQAVTVAGFSDFEFLGLENQDHEPHSVELLGEDFVGWGSYKWWKGSYLTVFTGQFSDHIAVGEHDYVPVLHLLWRNASTKSWRTEDEFEANATASITWTSPGTVGPLEEAISFSITNTSNNHLGGVPDRIGVSDLSFDSPTALNGQTTVLGYEWFQWGHGSFEDGVWVNPEHGHSWLTLKAKVEVVPLPAAAWMLLAGIGGLFAVGRRRAKAA